MTGPNVLTNRQILANICHPWLFFSSAPAPARVAYRRISIWRVIIDGCSLDSSLHTKPAGGGASNPDGGRRKNDSEWLGTCCWGVFFPMV